MKKVEIMGPKLLIGTKDYHQGDIVSVEDSVASRWIELGWAKDVETGEMGTRVPGANGPVNPATVTTKV